MESKPNRYQSRILREMHHNTENPFNSPPSSTGSHGTVTLTSNITMGPQGESTRRMDDLSINLPSMRNTKPTLPTSFEVNTSALGRTFPEWSRWNHQTDVWEDSIDNTPNPRGKENVTPRGSPNSSIVATPRADDSDRDKVSKHFIDQFNNLYARVRENSEITRQQVQASIERVERMNEESRVGQPPRSHFDFFMRTRRGNLPPPSESTILSESLSSHCSVFSNPDISRCHFTPPPSKQARGASETVDAPRQRFVRFAASPTRSIVVFNRNLVP